MSERLTSESHRVSQRGTGSRTVSKILHISETQMFASTLELQPRSFPEGRYLLPFLQGEIECLLYKQLVPQDSNDTTDVCWVCATHLYDNESSFPQVLPAKACSDTLYVLHTLPATVSPQTYIWICPLCPDAYFSRNSATFPL